MRRGHLPLAQHEAAAMALSPSQPRRKHRQGLLAEWPQPNRLEGAEQSILGTGLCRAGTNWQSRSCGTERNSTGDILPSAAFLILHMH